MIVFLTILAIMVVLGIVVFIYEISYAQIVDDEESFLWNDYDEKEDKTLK